MAAGKKDIFLTPLGSAGDVYPFIAVGRELLRRGHRVTVITNPYFEESVRGQGLAFEPLGTREDFLASLHHPDLWHPTRALFYVFRGGVLPAMRPLYEILRAKADPRTSVVGASVLAFGARLAREKLGLPLVSLHLQPSLFRSFVRPPAPVPAWLPAVLVRAGFALLDRQVDAAAAPGFNAFRQELGLPPVTRIMADWWHSPDRIVCLFPEWFAPPAPEWPARTEFAGFVFFDGDDGGPLDPALETFLGGGAPPVAFMAGSANAQAAGFFKASVAAALRLNRRGLLLSRFPEQLPPALPPSVMHVPFVPLSRLLPRVAVLVHHGGIGTTAQALAAGVPQLIRPLAHDQFDNARWVRRLGAGMVLSASAYDKGAAAPALERLMGDPAVAAAAKAAAERVAGVRALARACDAFA